MARSARIFKKRPSSKSLNAQTSRNYRRLKKSLTSKSPGKPTWDFRPADGKRLDNGGLAMETALAEKIVTSLKQAGVNFITFVPETRLSQILPFIQEDNFFQLVPVASEAEAVSIAAGASMAGKQSAAYMEGPGVWVSSYNLLTVGIRYGVPLLLLVGYVGSL